jgi:hypothetical protein
VFPRSNQVHPCVVSYGWLYQASSEEGLAGTRNWRFTVDLSTCQPRLCPKIHAKGL